MVMSAILCSFDSWTDCNHKANPLVPSEHNGKITKYEYDAAVRLVKEKTRYIVTLI